MIKDREIKYLESVQNKLKECKCPNAMWKRFNQDFKRNFSFDNFMGLVKKFGGFK